MHRLAAVMGLLCLLLVSIGLAYVAARAGCDDATDEGARDSSDALQVPVVDCRFYSVHMGEPVPNVGQPGSVLPPELRDAMTQPPELGIPEPPAEPPLPLPELLPDIADPNALLEAHGLPGDLRVPVEVQPPR